MLKSAKKANNICDQIHWTNFISDSLPVLLDSSDVPVLTLLKTIFITELMRYWNQSHYHGGRGIEGIVSPQIRTFAVPFSCPVLQVLLPCTSKLCWFEAAKSAGIAPLAQLGALWWPPGPHTRLHGFLLHIHLRGQLPFSHFVPSKYCYHLCGLLPNVWWCHWLKRVPHPLVYRIVLKGRLWPEVSLSWCKFVQYKCCKVFYHYSPGALYKK